MPVDEFGNRADIIADANSTISRMNLGRAYESYMGAYSRDNKHRLQAYFTQKHGNDYLYKLTKTDHDYARQYLRGMYSYLNSDMVNFIDNLNEEEFNEHLKECLTEEIYLYYPTDNERNIIDVIDDIEKTEYKPHMGEVSYIDEYGKKVVTKDTIRIGVLHIISLDKIAQDYSAVSSAKVNSFNFPIKGGAVDKYKYPHSLTPTTTLSETEVRILSSFAKPQLIGELVDLALNPVSHKLVIRNILEGEEAFSTGFDIDRDIEAYGQTKSLLLLRHMFSAAGFDLAYDENDQEYKQ